MNSPQTSNLQTRWILPAAITLLAIADGAIHFALDFVLFHGRFIGSPFAGPPPGAPAGGPGGVPGGGPPGPPPMPFPLPLNEMFLLNAIGYAGLVVLFWISTGWAAAWRWLLDAIMVVYTLLSIGGWMEVGRPNPHGLGYLAKGIEVALIVFLVADGIGVLREHWFGRSEHAVSRQGHQAV